MIQKIPPKTSSPRDLLNYVLDPAKGYVLDSSVVDPSVDELLADFEAHREMNLRVENLVTHMSLSLAPGERLRDAQWRDVATRYLQEMGYGDNSFVLVRHKDQHYEHVHIVVCRIRSDGSCVRDSFEWQRGERLMRRFEQELGLRRVLSSSEAPERALTRGEVERARREGQPSLRFELQHLIRIAAQDAPDFATFQESLEAEGVAVRVLQDRLGRDHGLTYEVDGVTFSGSQLGRSYTLGGLQRTYGLTPRDEAPAPPEPPAAPSEKEVLALRVREILRESPSLPAFLDSAHAQGLRLQLHRNPQGTVRGISYASEADGVYHSGTELGRDLTWGSIQKKLAGTGPEFPQGNRANLPESRFPGGNSDEMQAALRTLVEDAARSAADFSSFTELLGSKGVTLTLHASSSGSPRGVSYAQGPLRVSGTGLGPQCSLGGLERSFGLRPQSRGNGGGGSRVGAPPPPGLRTEVARVLHAAALKAQGSFTEFVLLAQDSDIGIVVYQDHTTRELRGIGYSAHGSRIPAYALGPELSLRGLESHFGIVPDSIQDAQVLARTTVAVSYSSSPPPHPDGPLLEALSSAIWRAASSSGDAADFVDRLASEEVELRLYVADGKPVQVAYGFGERFYQPHRDLDTSLDLPGLAEGHGIVFDPTRERALLEEIGVQLAPAASVDKVALLPEIASLVERAAGDGHSFADLVIGLENAGVKTHLFTRDQAILGISYEYRGVYVSGRSLGPEYTLSGLSEHLGVLPPDPVGDRDLLDSISKELPASPPNPRDLFEEVQDRIALAAVQAAGSPEAFLKALDQARIVPVLSVDEEDQIRGLVYRLQGRDIDARELGPAFTPTGLRSHHGIDLQAAPAKSVDRRLWTAELAQSLREDGRRPLVNASERLSREGPGALASLANARYVLANLTEPTRLLQVAARRAGAPARVASDALALLGVFSSPRVAVTTALRLTASSFARAARKTMPRHPGEAALAADLIRTYAEAALATAPSPSLFAARLRLAGIEISIESSVSGHPSLVYQIGEHLVPDETFGRQLTWRHLKRRFGETQDTELAAALTRHSLAPDRNGTPTRDPNSSRVLRRAQHPGPVPPLISQIEALAAPRVDLRITGPSAKPQHLRGLAPEEVRLHLGSLPAGTTIEVRPSDEPALQLIRSVSERQIANARAHGIEPALVVQTASDRYDVWVRHAPPGEELPSQLQRYLERSARLAYGQPAASPADRFGAVALESAQLVEATGREYSQARPTARYLAAHLEETQKRAAAACDALGLPTLAEFRRGAGKALSPREADIRWAEMAVARGLAHPQIATILLHQGTRAHANSPERALRYSLRVLNVALRSSLSLSPAATQAALLKTAAQITSLPIAALRVIGVVAKVASLALRL